MNSLRSRSGKTEYFTKDKNSGIFMGEGKNPRVWARGVIAPNIEQLYRKLGKHK